MPARKLVRHDYTLDNAVVDRLVRVRRTKLAKAQEVLGGDAWTCRGNPWTQRAVAARLGVTGACLNRWENAGHHPTSLSGWARWADQYGLDLARLIEDVKRQKRDGA